jgi:hypothetical protein
LLNYFWAKAVAIVVYIINPTPITTIP